jgi:hypothetical protein
MRTDFPLMISFLFWMTSEREKTVAIPAELSTSMAKDGETPNLGTSWFPPIMKTGISASFSRRIS